MAANRTPGGSVKVKIRKKYGEGPNNAFPIFDQKSALAAIKLRGHAPDPGHILDRALAWANKNNNQTVKDAVARARKATS